MMLNGTFNTISVLVIYFLGCIVSIYIFILIYFVPLYLINNKKVSLPYVDFYFNEIYFWFLALMLIFLMSFIDPIGHRDTRN
jgi:hypothetical protein